MDSRKRNKRKTENMKKNLFVVKKMKVKQKTKIKN